MNAVPTPGDQALSESEIHSLSHCLHTLRSVRRFLRADVDQASVDFVLRHAVQAGSAKNRQPWRFVVVSDRSTMSELGNWYRRGWRKMTEEVHELPDKSVTSDEQRLQMQEGEELARMFESTPVVIVACFMPIPRNPANFYGGASIYPALQNLLLAARALGLGATLTTLQSLDALPGEDRRPLTDDLRAILHIPEDAVPAAVIPLGWPDVRFTDVRRRPVHKVAYAERWGRPWPADVHRPMQLSGHRGHHADGRRAGDRHE
jgi:nitroreductase